MNHMPQNNPSAHINYPLRKQKFRIAVVSFFHETTTFCPKPASLSDWLSTGKETDHLLCDRREYITGFESRMRNYGGVELVGITSPAGMPIGGTSLSWNLPEVWNYYVSKIESDLKKKGPFDGIYLSMHGAMAVVGVARPEATLAKLVREICGPEVVITASFDLHACLDAAIIDNGVDAVFSVKRYPHFDTNLAGEMAADVMIRTLLGSYKPRVAVRKPGLLTPSFFQSTFRYPAREIMERARQWENRESDVYVNVNFGFAYADVPDNGASVFVVSNNNQALAEQIADDMNQFIWRHRKDFVFKTIYTLEEGVLKALEAVGQGGTPVVIADGCDRTGGSTWITRELIRQKAKRFIVSTLTDPEFIQTLHEKEKRPMDFTGPVKVAGKTDEYSGEPIALPNALISYLDKNYAVLELADNNLIVVSAALTEVTHPEWHGKLGIDYREMDIIVHKSRVHFFRGYYETGIAGDQYKGSIIKIEAPGWGPTDMTKIRYVNGGDHLYPIKMHREIGHVHDRPYIGEKDMLYQTGDGKKLTGKSS